MPTVVAALVASTTFSLGVWQVGRHRWREGVLAEANSRIEREPVSIDAALADPEAHRNRRARARGRLLHPETITVFELTPIGEEGVSILTPLELDPPASASVAVVLVDRGFVPAAAAAAFLDEDLRREPRVVEIVGRVVPLALQDVAPASERTARRDWLRFDAARPEQVGALQAQLSRPLAPVALEAAQGSKREFPRASISRPVSPVWHLGYAIFWFGVSAGALLTWIGVGRQRARDGQRAGWGPGG
ncbi:hypothetical protein MYXO_00660 [Myxococcaceae bacterium]|nr:hypothetical protein MYXO_00660 [Myxococcaceae bacterium]